MSTEYPASTRWALIWLSLISALPVAADQAARSGPLPPPPVVHALPPVLVNPRGGFGEAMAATGPAPLRVELYGTKIVTLRADLVAAVQPDPDRILPAAGPPELEIAVGNPQLLSAQRVGRRQLRLIGAGLGQTDVSIVGPTGEAEIITVQVAANLDALRAAIRVGFADAQIQLAQVQDHFVVTGQARDTRQVTQIIQTINAYLLSVIARNRPSADSPIRSDVSGFEPVEKEASLTLPPVAALSIQAEILPPQVINLIEVPGPQQVLVRVQIAELNRTAMRQLGVSFLSANPGGGFGQNVAENLPFANGGRAMGESNTMMDNPLSTANLLTSGAPLFGVIDDGAFAFYIDALRRNELFKVLAEPNLVALQGQEASFLAGGEFPIPVPQAAGTGGTVITVEYREFGVGLTCVPFILDTDRVRLSLATEVSSLDFTQGIQLQGFEVPALDKRRTSTVVELRHGQTLAISGLLQIELTGSTNRIPGLGDLPYLGAFFRNNSTRRTEKELVILVSPYLVTPLEAEQLTARPGDQVLEPDDREFYKLGHIEQLHGDCGYRSTASWADPLGCEQRHRAIAQHLRGPSGFTQ